MALETLKSVQNINGFKVMTNDDRPFDCDGQVDWKLFDKMRKEHPICIDHEANMISFKIQDGPIKEFGKNGCQVDELISTALLIIKGLNEKFPDPNNVKCMSSLYEAYSWAQQRKHERILRGVEGQSKA